MSGPPDLAGLQSRLQGARIPAERTALVGELLAALGDVVRGGGEPRSVPIAAEDLERWLESFDAAAVEAELSRAAEAAVEAALADSDREREEWEGWAMQALHSRDAMDRALIALAHLGPSEPLRARAARVASELAHLDARAPALARYLAGVNRRRREARARIAPPYRERAWWFCARADCDGLIALFRGARLETRAVHCELCARDFENASSAARPPQGCISADELWRLESGELPPARRRLMERHARTCAECALAVRALEVPLVEGEPASTSRSESARAPELLASRPEFQVLLLRGPRRIRIAPAPGQRLAAAAMLSEGRTAHAQRAGDAFEVKPLAGKQRLRVTLGDGRVLELALEL